MGKGFAFVGRQQHIRTDMGDFVERQMIVFDNKQLSINERAVLQ